MSASIHPAFIHAAKASAGSDPAKVEAARKTIESVGQKSRDPATQEFARRTLAEDVFKKRRGSLLGGNGSSGFGLG